LKGKMESLLLLFIAFLNYFKFFTSKFQNGIQITLNIFFTVNV
jgi:hypothetical protein